MPNRFTSAFAVAAALGLTGCVTVYQPLVSLQRPTTVDTQTTNFAGQRILVRCVPSEDLGPEDAQTLCRKVRSLFTNQGAEVEVEVPRGGSTVNDVAAMANPSLIVDLRARLLGTKSSNLLAILSVWTLTLVPNVGEFTFAQDITIRDGNGFQLATETMEARFVHYFGFGVWAVNGVLDFLVRSEEEKLGGGDVAKKDFSRDFYRQLSQVAFHASMRALVMRNFEEAPAPKTPSPSGSTE